MCEIVYNILITNFTVYRCIIRSNAPSNLQMQPLGCIFVYALNCITFGTAIDGAYGCPGYGLPDKLGLAHVVGRKPFCKLGVFFLGHACFDYPAAVRCVVSFSHGKTSFRLPHGCGGISGVSRMAGFGEGTPQQDSRRGKMSDKRILVLR